MFEFTIENKDFLNDFYREMKEYVKNSYAFTAKFLINPTLMENYKEQEKLALILLNKSIYQNIFNTMCQLDNNMIFSAMSCLENALYNIRLFYVLKLNKNNLYKYMTDEFFDLKKCEDIADKNTDFEEKTDFSIIDFYKDVKRNNRFEDIKAILPLEIVDGNLYMGLSNGNQLKSSKTRSEVIWFRCTEPSTCIIRCSLTAVLTPNLRKSRAESTASLWTTSDITPDDTLLRSA